MCKALYNDLDIEYQQAYSGPYQDLRCDGLVIAQKDGVLTGFGRPIIGDNLKEFERLYGIYHNAWYMDYLEDGKLTEISRFLLKEGVQSNIYYTQIIDLTKSIIELHADMRKSYQNLSNSYGCSTSARFDIFEEVHKRVFNNPRKQETYDIQNKMVQQNKAFVVHPSLYTENSNKACGLFYVNGKYCYYASGPSEISMHPIIWLAIIQAKHLGCTEFEMGEQVYSGTDKETGISSFKRGFGGSTKVRLEFKNVG